MSDSNITKRALAAALKELTESRLFSKISVGDICKQCKMSRKSFYYHFKDKYDLVNWIYDTEFVEVAKQKEYALGWELLEDMCTYFYDNRGFYRSIFCMTGQNSFSDYFHRNVAMIITDIMEEIYSGDDSVNFYVGFYSDTFTVQSKNGYWTRTAFWRKILFVN